MENKKDWNMIFRNSQRNKTDDEEQGSVLQVVVRFSGTIGKFNKSHYGGVAQLGEHLPCKQGVKGSNPFISTIGWKTETIGSRNGSPIKAIPVIVQITRAHSSEG